MLIKILALVLVLLIALAFGTALWVRLAPVTPARWHVDPKTAPAPGLGGYRTEITLAGPPETVLAQLDRIALETARTRRIAGSIEERRLTYETRSRLWGFPDYTTVSAEPAGENTRLVFLARLRFGKGDLGVNRTRVRGWIEALEKVIK